MTLDLSRWRFAITTVFHLTFVPLTFGLALLLAIMQTTPPGSGEGRLASGRRARTRGSPTSRTAPKRSGRSSTW
ncbi:MAG TPA: cytochrome ubiquinol oxidase subunit I [Acidimicrobiales bacterium]|nr:cytochrome ubiquinol oxidase subunit I [Acidimicrobiales bacterium]